MHETPPVLKGVRCYPCGFSLDQAGSSLAEIHSDRLVSLLFPKTPGSGGDSPVTAYSQRGT